MKKNILMTVIILSIGLVGCGSKSEGNTSQVSKASTGQETQEDSKKNKYEIKDNFAKGTVDSIMDGDSLYINWLNNGVEDNVQFYLEGIDAPEIEHPVYEKMPYGDEAKENLEKLVSPGDEVYIEFAKDDATSLVQRAFIYIKTDEEVLQLNNEQVKAGLAYVKSDEVLNQEQFNILKETEKQAKNQGLGIWMEKDLVVDGEFNRKYVKPGQIGMLKQKND